MIALAVFLFILCQYPFAFRKVNCFFSLSSINNRCKQNIITKHILLTEGVAFLIIRKIKEHRTHYRITLFGCNFHV